MARHLSRRVERRRARDANLKEKLKRNVDRKDCHFGVVNSKKLPNILVSCQSFSIILQIKRKYIALFVTPDTIFILDQNHILTKETTPKSVLDFINGFTVNRKLVLSRLKKYTMKFLTLCYKFILELYRNTSIDKIVKMLNLLIV